MAFQNVIRFQCGCIGLDVQDGAGNYLVLNPCGRHNLSPRNTPSLEWRRIDEEHTPIESRSAALAAINNIIALAAAGKKFQELKQLLKD